MQTGTLVKVEGLHKNFMRGGAIVRALCDINLELPLTCFGAISGPSGSGKSSLLNIIGMLDAPDQGTFSLCRQTINYKNHAVLEQIRRDKIGFVFQNFNLLPALTAFENVALPLFNEVVSSSIRKDRAENCLEAVGLEDRMHHFPRQLSGGQQQRVAIARALINDPVLVLADEPTANLDSKTALRILDLMLEMNAKRKIGFLFSTHDTRIIQLARQVVFLLDGRINQRQ